MDSAAQPQPVLSVVPDASNSSSCAMHATPAPDVASSFSQPAVQPAVHPAERPSMRPEQVMMPPQQQYNNHPQGYLPTLYANQGFGFMHPHQQQQRFPAEGQLGRIIVVPPGIPAFAYVQQQMQLQQQQQQQQLQIQRQLQMDLHLRMQDMEQQLQQQTQPRIVQQFQSQTRPLLQQQPRTQQLVQPFQTQAPTKPNARAPPAAESTTTSAHKPLDAKAIDDQLAKSFLKPSDIRKWQQQFENLLEFKRQHGHCIVPIVYKQMPTLGQWVKRQRNQYKKKLVGQESTLTPERQQVLDEVGFVWDSHQALWEVRLRECRIFRKKHKHCSIPARYPPNSMLAFWAKSQRRQYRICQTGGKTSLTDHRINELNKVGFVWNPLGCYGPVIPSKVEPST